MTTRMPAIALASVPGRRRKTLDLAQEAERRGYAGLWCASFGDAMGLCQALALTTETIPFGTSIVNMYARQVSDYALSAGMIQELSGGRFGFGVGVSHDAMNRRAAITKPGKPLADTREFVEAYKATPRVGELPPIILAALRKKMIALAGEIGGGVVFANVARSHVPTSLESLPAEKRKDPSFFIGDMIPTCISDDREAAAAVNRKTLTMYLGFPNYRNYWKEAGYVEEMQAVEKALAAKERERLPELMTDRWLSDVSLYGSVSEVREGLEAWFDAGVATPILVPSSAAGNQIMAFQELFAAFE